MKIKLETKEFYPTSSIQIHDVLHNIGVMNTHLGDYEAAKNYLKETLGSL